jgi:hypothetical protein
MTWLLLILLLTAAIVLIARRKSATHKPQTVATPKTRAPQIAGAVEPVELALASTPPPAVVSIPKPPASFSIQRQPQTSADCWVPPNKDVTVKGVLIQGGMIYVGTQLASVRGHGPEPALIDPAQPVEQSAANCHARFTSYWPGYDTITPEARASYLRWLATGKCDPEADLGYVFLYFYGLERRALWDAINDPQTNAELPLIEQEVRRLLHLYGNKGSFCAYASSFLDYLSTQNGEQRTVDDLTVPPAIFRKKPSLDLRVGLGLHSRAGRPLSAAWAIAWYLSAPNLPRRPVVARCPDLFASLFKTEYEKQFSAGLKLPVNKTRIRVTHRAASASFAGERFTAGLDLPDVSVLSGPLRKLQEVGDRCSSLLLPYCRFLDANPDQANSPEAWRLLPEYMAQAGGASAIRLDLVKVAALRADSAKVSALLGSVYDAAAERDELSMASLVEDEPSLRLELDAEHASLLQLLLQRDQWSRAELEEVCADRGLMVDGAIERINEAAFARFDQALIEGEDPIAINCELMLEETV